MFEKPDIGFHRDRKVQQPERAQRREVKVTPKKVSDSKLRDLIDDVNGVKDKAQRLLDAISANPNKRYIPVDESATAVRLAVARLDPNEPSGARISYELYKAEIDRASAIMTKEETLEFVGGLTGVMSIDSSRTSTAAGSGGAEDNTYMFSSAMHALLLWLLGQLLAGHTANEASKQGGPTAPAGVASSWAIAIMMLAAQHAGGDKAITKFMDRLLKNNPHMRSAFGDAMDAMKKGGLTPDGFMDEVEDYDAGVAKDANSRLYEEPDWMAMREYANQKIADDPDYADWGAANELVSSVKEFDAMGSELAEWGETNKAIAGLPKDTYDVVKCNIEGTNLNLDMTASLLSSHYAADMVCCLVRWLGSEGLGTSTLKTIRSLLKFQADGMTMDLQKVNAELQKLFRQRVEAAIIRPLTLSIRKVFQKWSKELSAWIDPKTHVDENASEKKKKQQLNNWKQLFTCTPIDEMVRHMIAGLRYMEKFLVKLLKMLWDSTRQKNRGWRLKVEVMGDKKSINSQIQILDSVIKAIEKGKLCDTKDTKYPDEETIRELAKGILNQTPPMLPLSPPEGREEDPHWRFNPVSFTTPTGLRIAPWDESAKQVRDVSKISAKDCIKGLTDENVIPYPVDPSHTEVTRNVRELRNEIGEEFFRS